MVRLRYLLFIAVLAVLFSPPTEAQVFPNAFWNRTSSCAGSQTSSPGLFARMAQRRASRVQARTQTTGCGGTVSYQEYAPSVVNHTQAPVQATPACIDGQCPVPTKSFPKTISTPDQLFGLSVANDSLEIPNHILAQIAIETTFGLETNIPDHVLGQVDSQPVKVADSFRPSLLKAIAEGRKSGKLTVRDAVKLRVACLSPAFVERAHELAVTQMAFSGEASDAVPLNDEGMIQTQGINWEGLAKFLEVLIPLLLKLLIQFGM